MSVTICISASTLYYPKGGGHMWVYLNWALGFLSNRCRVIWLEELKKGNEDNNKLIVALRERLKPFNLENCIALWQENGALTESNFFQCISVEEAAKQCDLLLNQDYVMPSSVINLFKRSALLDIDPGLLQMWVRKKAIELAPHNYYFTIGETVGQRKSLVPDCGLRWIYTPPCVSLDHWPVTPTSPSAAFTTVTHWSGKDWEEDNGKLYNNNKRSGFLPFIELPKYAPIPLELAILLSEDEEDERMTLQSNGWRLIDSHIITSTPLDYQKFIQHSSGEFSCVKPSCIRLQNAWISDRTLCYLASGKPAVVQHTGPSSFLPDCAGFLRFKTFDEAIECLKEVEKNYDYHCRLARELTEEFFDAKRVCWNLLERALN